jgi:predicted unusual protein kinase regulating ubiquinone biosynthesis (AarF/ABC1/UbiB family)
VEQGQSARALDAGVRPPRPPARPWRTLGIEPALRLAAWAAATLAGRARLALLAPFAGRERRRAAWLARSAERLVATLGALKGAFVKAGQFAAHRPDVVPNAVGGALAALRDRVPPLPFAQIRPLVEAELGAPLEQLFAAFEEEPLGAASVAQVHRARLASGAPVAVKVQYPWLEAALPADLALLRWLAGAAARLRAAAALDAPRLFAEFAAGLREELDFAREAQVAAQIAANLAGDPQVVVPRVIPSHSSRRVLTTSYHAAVPLHDRAGLARLGVAPGALVAVIARAYAKQVFADGLFHADPHPGNLFVLDEPTAAARPRVLFVDFGLSRRLEPELRRELRLGIHALLRRDLEGFVAGMQRTRMIAPGAEPGVRRALEGIFERLRGAGAPLALSGSGVLALKDEGVALLRATPGLQLPDALLLFAKTLSYVFGLARELDPEADALQPTLPWLLRFLGERD